ncbi:MAG TPA: hypothetical protein VJ987_14820 [Anaerolineales bacterium]|nr:hypothetical protein [Anaerolineales bacterium]
MKYLILLISIFITACAASTPQPTPTPVPTATPRPVIFEIPSFIFQGDDPSIPIVTHNPSSRIENLYINPGAVIFHDGKFHMFFNSFTSWPGVVQVGYATSDNGYQWQMVQEEPVFTTDQIPFGDGKADVSSVIVLEDGTWALYFHTVGGGEIGRAIAESPLGPWTVDANPILKPNTKAWDRYGLGWPSVVQDGSEYRMYYGAQTREGYAIGLATSNDGVQWEKYPEPVLVADADWEYNKVDRPRVVNSPDNWVMIYQAGTKVEERGLAISNDGIHWERYSANPIFDQDVFPIPNAKTWDTNLLYHEGTYYYFMELGTLSGTDLYLTTRQGTLRK